MEMKASEPNPAEFLPWLVAMGADEVLLDQPVNRFAAATAIEPVPAKPAVARAPAKPAVNWKAAAAGADGLAAAEALASAIDSLESYANAVASFEVHPLQKTASRVCSLSGNMSARTLLLCDRPRNEEDRSGEVLSGNSKILAQRMFKAIGQTAFSDDPVTDTILAANFIPWRPPGNRTPTELEAQMMVPLVRKLIQLVQPVAIMCFGSLAGQRLAGGEEAIPKARGAWLEADGYPLLTTFHPETLLKSAASKRLAWQDMQMLQQKLEQTS